MGLTFLMDENILGWILRAIQRHNLDGQNPIDFIRAGDPLDLPLGSDDPTILQWAAREGRILVTEDRNTIPAHLTDFLSTGAHSPGVFILRAGTSVPQIVEQLVLIAHGSEPEEWQNRVAYIPLN